MISHVRITPRAFEDLRSIGRYTLRRWGRAQRDAYLRGLDARFAWLAANPALGRRRDEIGPDYRSFAYEAYLIFYIEHEGCIDVIGIPHQAQDLPAHFFED